MASHSRAGSGIPVAVVVGTRPEAIKLAPVAAMLLQSELLRPIVVATGQHRDLLDQALAVVGLRADHDLDLFRPGQPLNDVIGRALLKLGRLLRDLRPALVLVQGDTTSALAGALAAFHERIPVGHVEAGLRTDDPWLPFPEEMNRRLIARVAALHFAPTVLARERLLGEGVPDAAITVSGNPVIDGLRSLLAGFTPPCRAATGRRLALVTIHRRENWGEPLERIAAALVELARRVPDLDIVFPAHPNAAVRMPFDGLRGVQLIEPLPYDRFVMLMATADVVLTDSGGIQEETPWLGTPTVVLRDVTERTEALATGCVVLAGTDPDRIVAAAEAALAAGRRPPVDANPFGDGHAAERIVAACERYLVGDAQLATTVSPA